MNYLIKLNKEELGLGAVFGAAFWPVLGFKAIAAAILCMILWAVGGSGYGRVWRYLGCPAVVFVLLVTNSVNAIFALKACAAIALVLSFGYGIPDPPDRKDRDEGSLLGRLFYALARGNQFWSNIFTREFYAFALCIGPVIFLAETWPYTFFTMIIGHIACVLMLEGEIII